MCSPHEKHFFGILGEFLLCIFTQFCALENSCRAWKLFIFVNDEASSHETCLVTWIRKRRDSYILCCRSVCVEGVKSVNKIIHTSFYLGNFCNEKLFYKNESILSALVERLMQMTHDWEVLGFDSSESCKLLAACSIHMIG